MQNLMSVKQFKHFIKTQMKRIEDISCNITSDIYANYNQSNAINLTLPKFYDSYKKQYTHNIQISSWEYLLSAQSVGCWKLFKAHNIQLNYHFIRFVVESEYPGTKIFRWLLENTEYVNQFLSVRAFANIFPNLDDFCDPFGYDYKPVKFEEFVYQCLKYQDFHKVNIIAKTNYDINENHLLERIVVEYNTESDWDVGYLLNLFAAKPYFNFNSINSFLKIKLLYLVCENMNIDTLNKYYPNILANGQINAYIKGAYPESEYQLTKAKLKKYFVFEYNYNTHNVIYLKDNNEYEELIINDELDDNVIYDPLGKYVYNIQIGSEIYDNRYCRVVLNNFSVYLKSIKLIG
jgi:hypothetical protein